MGALEDDVTRVESGYAAFARGDMTALAEVLAPDVEWVIGGRTSLSGTYRGRDAVFGFLGRALAATDGTLEVRLRTLAEPEPGLVLALVRLVAQRDGRSYDEPAVQQVQVRDGLVVRCETYTQHSRFLEALSEPVVITLPGSEQVRTHAV